MWEWIKTGEIGGIGRIKVVETGFGRTFGTSVVPGG